MREESEMIYTTYELAVKYSACERALVAFLNKSLNLTLKEGQTEEINKASHKFGVDKVIPLTDILDVLGIDDCFWAFRTVQDKKAADTIIIKFFIAIADKMLIHFESKYPEDKRPCKAIEALRAYFSNPSNKAAYVVEEAYEATLRANIDADDRNALLALLAGGVWSTSSYCGSRARGASSYRWYTISTVGGRALSEEWLTAKLKELLEES